MNDKPTQHSGHSGQSFVKSLLAEMTVEEKVAQLGSALPGEVKRVSFYLPTDLLAFYGENMNLLIEPGKFRVMVGSSSKDIRLSGEFKITREIRIPDYDRDYLTETLID